MKSAIKLFIILLSLSIMFIQCKKKKLNDSLYNESKASGLTFYKGKDTIYGPAGTSPHGNFKLKFNSTATAAFGVDGKLPSGTSFPEGSIIVKEILDATNNLSLIAIMKKDSKSKYAASGWVWAEYEPDGKIKYNIKKKGDACVSCHSSGGNRDLALSFSVH